jgi:hypothetical protein
MTYSLSHHLLWHTYKVVCAVPSMHEPTVIQPDQTTVKRPIPGHIYLGNWLEQPNPLSLTYPHMMAPWPHST